MGYDLKGKMADMAGDTLKNVEDGGNKLSSENTESAQKLSNKTTHTTLEASREVRWCNCWRAVFGSDRCVERKG